MVKSLTVWLAAIMTTVVQTPHVHCRCPDGHVKLFCLSSLLPTNGCCCAGSRCDTAGEGNSCCHDEGESSSAHSCCCPKANANSQTAPQKGQQASSHGCEKESARLASFTTTSVVQAADAFGALAAVHEKIDSVDTAGNPAGRLWLIHRILPPADLLALLCHLVI